MTKYKSKNLNEAQFSVACIEGNNITELLEALRFKSADKTDCKRWGITPTQWRNAIISALHIKFIGLTKAS